MKLSDAADSVRSVATACRICAVGCGTIVELRGTRVVKVSGDPDDPWSRGFLCGLGRAAPEFHHRPDRLNVPQVRRNGVLLETSWPDALDDIAAHVCALIDEHGCNGVAHYTGTGGPLDPSGYAMAHGLFRSIGTEQNYSALSVDCSGKFLVPELVAGVQLPFQPDLDGCTLLLAIGVNPVVSHGHGVMTPNPLDGIRALHARGGSFVVVDPRHSETAHHADLHLAVRPGTDPALLAFLIRHVLHGRRDHEFLAACADPAGLERLSPLVEPFDTALTAATCDVAISDLERLAELLDASGRVAIETGTGVSMSRSANITEWLVWALAAVTGSLDRAGGVRFNPGFLRPIEDSLPSGRGDLLARPASRPDLPRIVNGEMPCAALCDEIEAGTVRALFVRVGNPALAFPDTARTRAALSKLELLAVLDAQPTATTALATHVLPMADHFERGDVLSGYLQAKPFLRWAPAIVEPLAERRPQWWVFAELSRRLGHPLLGSARADVALAASGCSDETVAATLARSARRPWSEVVESGHGIRDDVLAPGWLIPQRLPRPLDLAPAELVAQFEEGWLGRLPPAGGVVLVNGRTRRRYNSFRPVSDDSAPALAVSVADAERFGFRNVDRVRVTSEHGSCVALADVTDTMRPGVVSLSHGSATLNVNELTSTREIDPRNGMPVLSGIAVTMKVER